MFRCEKLDHTRRSVTETSRDCFSKVILTGRTSFLLPKTDSVKLYCHVAVTPSNTGSFISLCNYLEVNLAPFQKKTPLEFCFLNLRHHDKVAGLQWHVFNFNEIFKQFFKNSLELHTCLWARKIIIKIAGKQNKTSFDLKRIEYIQ